MNDNTPTVLFLCVHNAGRSLAARVLMDHYAAGRVRVESAGSEPGRELTRFNRWKQHLLVEAIVGVR